ncbi:MAG TPA: ISKra4 family transposase, partial [Geminicoccaceae bacterium]|nr:ISKra4 family transposase [Geminicoccaceae bacterium]
MRVRILLQVAPDDGAFGEAEEVGTFAKGADQLEEVGLSLAESKAVLAALQRRTIELQAAAWIERRRRCTACGKQLRIKGSYPIIFRTLFGDIHLASPRFHRCRCRDQAGTATVSPLKDLLSDHTAPERLYLETRWASLVPYAATAELLADVLPIGATINATTIRAHVLRVAERAEAELGEERPCFIDGGPADWQELPPPEGRIVVGLDGGYVRDWREKISNFEVIVGRSMPEDRAPRYLGLVHGHDRKPKRRLVDILRSQGLQPNQGVTFLTDGGDEIKALTELISPCGEHVLDWFHIAMRLTVLGQYAKGVAQVDAAEGTRLLDDLGRLKWRLWHGDIHRAVAELGDLADDVDGLELAYPNLGRFRRAMHEFAVYIAENAGSIINYGERYRAGER